MAAITASNLDALFKRLYAGQTVQNLVYDAKARPFLTMLKKMKSFGGTVMPLPVVTDDVLARSATFSNAQTNLGNGQEHKFLVDIVKNYAVCDIETEAILRAEAGDKVAFTNSLKFMIDSSINALANDLEASLFRDGSGSLGTISSGSATTEITLTNVEDVVNFAVGQKVVFAADTASALEGSGSALTVSAVNRGDGKVTFSAAPNTIGSTTDGHAMFIQGDYASASDRLKLAGLARWLPTATELAASPALFNVTRTTDPTRLAGVRYSGSASNITESVKGGASILGRESNAAPDIALMSFDTFNRLNNEVESQVQRDAGGKAVAGFQTISVYGPRGVIECIPCTFCQQDTVWLLSSNSWMLVSIGDPVRIIDKDGLKVRARDGSDAFEVRVASFSNLACVAPGRNCRITLS